MQRSFTSPNIEVNQVCVTTWLLFICIYTQSRPRFPLQVCVPGVHISLGIFFRLYEFLDEAAHKLDLLMVLTLGRDPSQQCTLPGTFQEYVQIHHGTMEEANKLADQADFFDSLAHWNRLRLRMKSRARKFKPYDQQLKIQGKRIVSFLAMFTLRKLKRHSHYTEREDHDHPTGGALPGESWPLCTGVGEGTQSDKSGQARLLLRDLCWEPCTQVLQGTANSSRTYSMYTTGIPLTTR